MRNTLLIIASVLFLTLMGVSCRNYGYDDIYFKERDDIVCLTGLDSFPEYQYESHSYDYWNGIHYVRYKFKEALSATFKENMEMLCKQGNNIYWTLDTLSSSTDKQDFGSDFIFVYHHGWDGKYINAPNDKMPESANVLIAIGDNGFVVKYKTGDSPISIKVEGLDTLTGVHFPPYKVVQYFFTPCGFDFSEDLVIELDEKPSSKFIKQINSSPNWSEDSSCYMFYNATTSGEDGSLCDDMRIVVDKNSGIVRIQYCSY